jgi:hypothetical protein
MRLVSAPNSNGWNIPLKYNHSTSHSPRPMGFFIAFGKFCRKIFFQQGFVEVNNLKGSKLSTVRYIPIIINDNATGKIKKPLSIPAKIQLSFIDS